MRDPHAPDHLPPPDWASAFAALPPETPPADALSSVFARIPASTPARSGRHWWIAAAAVLALTVVIPLATQFVRHPGASRGPAVALVGNAKTLDPGLRRDDGAGNATLPLQNHTPDAVPVLPVETASDRKTLDPGLRRHLSQPKAVYDEQKHSTPVRIAKADTPHRTRKSVPATDPTDKAMEPLYAESARLEALLALARDDRVSSATAVALGSDFEARIAGIDAALIQPSLTSQRRLELWRDRVSALRAYASFESTQRALAASGERYDAMLVSID